MSERAYRIPDPSTLSALPPLDEGVDPHRVVFARMSVMVSQSVISNPRLSGRPPDNYFYGDVDDVHVLMMQVTQDTLDRLRQDAGIPDAQQQEQVQEGQELDQLPEGQPGDFATGEFAQENYSQQFAQEGSSEEGTPEAEGVRSGEAPPQPTA